ncbi:MAG: scavenger receptor cysteine-rich domain-containing protein [Sandaracinaceae bacterium]|nr:scavenger receptor cysteine-rich domain-containing protein [Sandaracinaceae bacterium]
MVQGFAPTFPCPRCAAALPAGSAFCDRCGADARMAAALAGNAQAAQRVMRARPGFVAVGRGMSVCHACGALAPSKRGSCEVCAQPIGSSLEAVPARSDDLAFAQIRTQITCRQCGGVFPIDEPELEESVTCPRCNTIQAFDNEAWSEAFAHAHLVADVHGPRGEEFRRRLGARDPFPAIGSTTAIGDLQLSGMSIEGGVMKTRNLRASVAPGQPLCTKCGSPREPLELAGLRGAPELQMRCVGCGDTARYTIPSAARGLCPGLVGFVSEALRVDRPEARLDQTSAGMVVALKCPSCGGGLNVTPGSHVAVCGFCKTEARIASRTLLALKSIDAAPIAWWALFRGDAPGRNRLFDDERDSARELGLNLPAGRGGGHEAQLLALMTMAEAPGGSKAVSRAVSEKVKDIEDDQSPWEVRKEWAIQLALPMLMLVLVSPLFFRQFLNWSVGAPSVAPSIAHAYDTLGNPVSQEIAGAGVPVVIALERNGEIRPVCDDGFGIEEANVACRQMGFQGARSYSTVNGWMNDFWLDDVVCQGSELRLDDCAHEGWGDHNCSSGETQAVSCIGAATEPVFEGPSDAVAAGPSGMPLPPEQNVTGTPLTILLMHDGVLRPVCDDGFGIEEANVACRQLGHHGAAAFSTVNGSTSEFWLDDIDCTGTELRLDDCRHPPWGQHNCSSSETQAVTCF